MIGEKEGNETEVGDFLCWGVLKNKGCNCNNQRLHIRECAAHVAFLLGQRGPCDKPKYCTGDCHSGASTAITAAALQALVTEHCTEKGLASPNAFAWKEKSVVEEALPPSLLSSQGLLPVKKAKTSQSNPTRPPADTDANDGAQGFVTTRGGRSIDFLLERVRATESPNPYLGRFAAAPWVERLLSDSRFHSLVAVKRKSLEKDIRRVQP